MASIDLERWELVIGLEIHVQLRTLSKLFSGSAIVFGESPNLHANEVDLALPGTLPVVNEEAIKMAIQFGLAVDAKINQRSVFERKNYFYPDLPKGYQTTQSEHPIVGAGNVEVFLNDTTTTKVRIHHAHLEEDAGKSVHDEFEAASGIDLNRAGTPLIEIVTEPDMRSAQEAVTFLRQIHAIITTIGISDGDMSKASMRCDANVSLRPRGSETLGTRTELKNINSFRFVERAINTEAQRQADILEDGGSIVQETRLYDSIKNETRPMRNKEIANDYRYFPCPDLLPVEVSTELIEQLKSALPELPRAKQQRFVTDYQLSSYDAQLLTQSTVVSHYFEQTVKACNSSKLCANWINGDITARLNKAELDIDNCPISPNQLGLLITRIEDATISGKIAKQLFEKMWSNPSQKNNYVDILIEEQGLKQVSDSSALEGFVDQIIADNPRQVDNYRQATDDKRKKMFGFFVGQVMKLSKGQANPQEVNKIIQQKLRESFA